MAQAQSDDSEDQGRERCRALTASGERCSRPAREDGFCYQHDEDDPTVDESAADEATEGSGADDEGEADEAADADDEGGTVEADETAEEARETPEEGESETDAEADESEADAESAEDAGEADDGPTVAGGGVLEIRETVASVARDVVGRALDGVVEVNAQEDGWRAEVEVIERRAVPDTQDILGRYELLLDGNGEVQSYRRLDRYRRGDTTYEE